MGRKKIKIEYLKSKTDRQVSKPCFNNLQLCFNKRKKGIIKKANELAKLTGAKVFVTIITEDEHTATSFKSCSHTVDELIPKLRTFEIFGSDLEFAQLENRNADKIAAFGVRQVRRLAENGVVNVKYGEDARVSASKMICFIDDQISTKSGEAPAKE